MAVAENLIWPSSRVAVAKPTRAERSDVLAVLSVVDDGTGMNAEDASRAFDRFWRGDPARARTGTGLGLAITRSIAEAHGGRASLESHPGSGTTVRVVVPFSSEPLVAGLAEGTRNWSA